MADAISPPLGFPCLDVPVYNASGATIPAGTAVIFDLSNPPSGDLPVGVKVPATSGSVAQPFGILTENLFATSTGPCRVLGAYAAVAGTGGVTNGDWVKIDAASGKEGRVTTASTNDMALGQAWAVGGTAADGAPVLVFVSKTKAP